MPAGDHPGPRNAWVCQVLKCRSGAPDSRAWWYRRAECTSERSWAVQEKLPTRRFEDGTGPYVGVCRRTVTRSGEAAHCLDQISSRSEEGVLSIVLYTQKETNSPSHAKAKIHVGRPHILYTIFGNPSCTISSIQ
jgi:hypothetical protein